mmetsp:Transcript_13543/g.26038  ORF Transcript_13543/g.26038 Transcript_13543/m.26038 type:complete len:213 (-) Transcript_13543:332-970(-)|eukprot:CAMPEP_0114225662 /NCGR_PEP_ID=MMETSP0058-20121206/797_1 /TAXON_ID=36894 /ORGANISM="Pyramimonas parkeae, CCMP726" /LENGTH=212 /DNA_ID=CAMNT_0001336293 /DNA_START=354 /DNA_END=992 /DNA_ORIENTATION=+
MDACTIDHFNNLSPAEMEFNAEYEEVDIIPDVNIEENELNFIEGKYGPFRTRRQARVPLWLALFLKRRRRCSICMPEWLQLEKLEQHLELERGDEQGFQALPYHFSEMSEMLFKEAKDDVDKFHQVREKVSDIVSVRRNKIFAGLSMLRSSAPVELGNICNIEVCLIRNFMQNALGRYYKHDKASNDAKLRAAEAAALEAQRARTQVAPQQR